MIESRMFVNVCVFALLVVQTLSSGRYFVGEFEGSYNWAYPIDICAVTNLLTQEYILLTCSEDGSMITQATYSDDKCTTLTAVKNYTMIDEKANGLYEFNCDGTQDYVQIELLIGSCSKPYITGTVYAAANACFEYQAINHSSLSVYEQSQCNSTAASIASYIAPLQSCDSFSGYAKLHNITYLNTTCTYYLTQQSAQIFAKVKNCVYNNYSQMAITQGNNASYTKSETKEAVYKFSFVVQAVPQAIADPDVCGYDWFTLFTTAFDGCLVSITTMCESNEGQGYASISIKAYVEIFSSSSLYKEDGIESCGAYNTTINSLINDDLTGVYVSNITCSRPYPTTTKSFGHMHAVNYLMAFVTCFAIISMYII